MIDKIKQLTKLPLLVIFFIIIFGITAIDLIKPDRKFSELENRYLQMAPQFRWDDLFQNRYTLKYEEYVNDQFLARDSWIDLKSKSESVLGKIENNNIVYGKDDYMFEKLLKTDEKRLDKNTAFIQEFAEKYPDLPITFTIIPNAYTIMNDKLPAGLEMVDQAKQREEIYNKINAPNVNKITYDQVLMEHRGEYIYYMTDHHWTTYGAYLAYSEFAGTQNMEPVALNEIAEFEKQVYGFYGTYYSKAKRTGAKSDTISYYDIPVKSVNIDGKEKDSLYDMEKWSQRDKYAGFLWGNNGLTIIESNLNKNAIQGKKSRIMVIKDSYGNSFVPFLSYNYDEIWVVDLRSVGKLSEIISKEDFDCVLVMYSFGNFSTDSNIAKLRF